MMRTYLTWIDDEHLLSAIDDLTSDYISRLESYEKGGRKFFDREGSADVFAKAITGRGRNNKERYAYSALQMSSYKFHKRIIASCVGWQEVSYTAECRADIQNDENTIFAELLSTRYSIGTQNVKKRISTILQFLRERPKYLYYLVFIDETKAPALSRMQLNEQIRPITGSDFYHLVTGLPDAKDQLFEVLPKIIKEYLPGFVFLSYSRKNSHEMVVVRDALVGAGIKVWTDDNLIPGTPEWTKEIQNAIENCGGLVVLLSPSAKASEWVNNEIEMAKVQGKKIFPFIVNGDASNAIPIPIIRTQWIDATNSMATGIARLTPVVKDHLRDLRGK